MLPIVYARGPARQYNITFMFCLLSSARGQGIRSDITNQVSQFTSFTPYRDQLEVLGVDGLIVTFVPSTRICILRSNAFYIIARIIMSLVLSMAFDT